MNAALPAAWTARTGQSVLLPDRAAGRAWSAQMAAVYDSGTLVADKGAFAALPLRSGDRLLGSLCASWAHERPFSPQDVDLLTVFAVQISQVLERLQVRTAERQAAAASRQLSETLQRSMLTSPPELDHLQIAVRYLPAASDAQIGGDWYDSFLARDATMLVVGDVAGHDRDAAAAMGQIRNLLRGVAQALGEPPATVLRVLDRAMCTLGLDTLATVVLAQIEQPAAVHLQAQRVLRWSNAGHPPPLLLHAGGASELLERPAELLLGLDPDTPRTDHDVVLEPGTTVVLFTDGLVERSDRSLDQGLHALQTAAAPLHDLPLEDLCDQLLHQLLGHAAEDDIALIAVRSTR